MQTAAQALTVNHIKDSNFSVCKRHSLCKWRCNIAENWLFVRLWREFIVNLWVNWNLGWCRIVSNLQAPVRVFTVCARCFSAFCACPELCYRTSGIMLLVYGSILRKCLFWALKSSWEKVPQKWKIFCGVGKLGCTLTSLSVGQAL